MYRRTGWFQGCLHCSLRKLRFRARGRYRDTFQQVQSVEGQFFGSLFLYLFMCLYRLGPCSCSWLGILLSLCCQILICNTYTGILLSPRNEIPLKWKTKHKQEACCKLHRIVILFSKWTQLAPLGSIKIVSFYLCNIGSSLIREG